MKLNARFQAAVNGSMRRNHISGIVNGALTQLGMNLTHPSLVLSVFVRVLGGSNALVGSLSAIRFSIPSSPSMCSRRRLPWWGSICRP